MPDDLVDWGGAGVVLQGNVKVTGCIQRDTVRRRRRGVRRNRAANAGDRNQVRRASRVGRQRANAVVHAIGDVEAVGAVHRQASRAVEALSGGGTRGRSCVAGVALSADGQPCHRADVANRINLAHAVVQRVGDELVAVGIEHNIRRIIKVHRRSRAKVGIKASRCTAGVAGTALHHGNGLGERGRRGNQEGENGENEEGRETAATVSEHERTPKACKVTQIGQLRNDWTR